MERLCRLIYSRAVSCARMALWAATRFRAVGPAYGGAFFAVWQARLAGSILKGCPVMMTPSAPSGAMDGR